MRLGFYSLIAALTIGGLTACAPTTAPTPQSKITEAPPVAQPTGLPPLPSSHPERINQVQPRLSWLPKVDNPSNVDQTVVWGQLPNDKTLWNHVNPDYFKMIRAGLPAERAFKYTFGDGKRELLVFFDPTSGYDLGMLKGWVDHHEKLNATLYLFPYSAQQEAQQVIDQLICSSNPAQAWLEWSLFAAPDPNKDTWDVHSKWQEWGNTHPSQNPKCAALKNKQALQTIAKRLDVSFTPTIIFANGEAWPGPTMTDQELEQVWGYVHGRLGL